MFNIVDYPPALGECSFCKKHDCGTKEDGTQMWLHSPIELHLSGDLIIGYKCVKSMSDNMDITVNVIEREVLLTPTVEQIGEYVRKAVNNMSSALATLVEEDHETHVRLFKTNAIKELSRAQLKQYLIDENIDFVPQWGDYRLREEALKHV